MKNNVTDKDIKELQKLNKKWFMGYNMQEDLARKWLEETTLQETIAMYQQIQSDSANEMRDDARGDRIATDLIRGGFIGLVVGVVFGLLDGELFSFAILGVVIGSVTGAFTPPMTSWINEFQEKRKSNMTVESKLTEGKKVRLGRTLLDWKPIPQALL